MVMAAAMMFSLGRQGMQAMIQNIRYRGTGTCRAGLEDDAPFALAIVASVLSTLVLPADTLSEDTNESLSPLGGDDVRYAAMGIISFIPLFNWLVLTCLLTLRLVGHHI